MKEYKNHNDVDQKYKWDLAFLLEGKKPEQALAEIVELFKKAIAIKDSKYESPGAYLASLKDAEKLTVKFNKFTNYFMNLGNLDITNPVPKTLEQKFSFEMYKLQSALGSEKTRFFKHAKKLAKWAKLPEFKDYKYSIEHQLQEKRHLLSKVVEEYKIKVSRGAPNFNEVFGSITDSELDYGFALSSLGKKTKITRANRSKLLKNDDKQVRKSTVLNYRKAYLKHKDSLASLLYQHKRYESAHLMAAHHQSSVAGLVFSDRVDDKFLNVLYTAVQKNIAVFKPYRKAYKRFYKKRFGEAITDYDWERPLVKVSQTVTVAKAIRDVQTALRPLGNEYSAMVKKALAENWVDFMTIKNKRSGAYSIGATYGVKKKLILMNFTGDLRAGETLAHEIGHSMHSYFSDKVQTTAGNSSYPIFLAEVASIFNELMLNDYYLQTLTNKRTKWYILNNMITGFMATVLRQTEWSNYEYDLYHQIDKGKPVGTYSALANIYYQNAQKYAVEKKRKYDPKKQWAAVYVPHFYYGFYVYKYAIGQLVANIFFYKYKTEGPQVLRFYIANFLSRGGSKNPLDILKDAGVDLMDPKVYEIGFKQVKALIDEWMKLGNEIFKP